MNKETFKYARGSTAADSCLISIGICTFRRPELFETLTSIGNQIVPDGYTIEVIVADNDDVAELGPKIAVAAQDTGLNIRYRPAPARNIAIARNACLDAAEGEALIFIDDDETADPGWLENMLRSWRRSGSSVIFGPTYAIYPEETPEWMVENDVHSNIPLDRDGVVETGYSCNVLLDLRNARVRETRFDEAYGRTGGEDTDFFFRLHRRGVDMNITLDAKVREPVAEKRMSKDWVMQRRFSTGQAYGHCLTSAGRNAPLAERLGLVLRAGAKSAYCRLRAGLTMYRESTYRFWMMRSMFHAGVARGACVPPQTHHYGGDEA